MDSVVEPTMKLAGWRRLLLAAAIGLFGLAVAASQAAPVLAATRCQ